MKKITLFFVFAAGIFLLSFRGFKGDEKMASITPAVSSFDEIEIDAGVTANVTVREGSTPAIKLSGDEDMFERILVKVQNGRLIIHTKPNRGVHFNGLEGVTADITLPRIKELEIAGSSTTRIYGNIDGKKFAVKISGSGNTTIDHLNVQDFVSGISGSGKVTIMEGNVTSARYDITGSGKIKAFDLHVKDASAYIVGSGKCEINTTEKLEVEVSGSGSVAYKGHPAIVRKEITGSGSVRVAE